MTYAQMTEVLVGLGFERRAIRGSHVLFTHKKRKDAILMFPRGQRSRSKVREAHVISTRFFLDAMGFLSTKKWDRLYWSFALPACMKPCAKASTLARPWASWARHPALNALTTMSKAASVTSLLLCFRKSRRASASVSGTM